MALLTREWDLMELPGGEILTTVGTYRGPWARGRLTYAPDEHGAVTILGRLYRKIAYDITGRLAGARQVLALPGECHYEVPARHVARHYPANTPSGSHPELAGLVSTLADLGIPLGLGGSRAVGASRGTSDYDLVVYGLDNIARAAKIIAGITGYRPDCHFGMGFVYAKYRHFHRLTTDDLDRLVADRWRHFRFRGHPVSVDGAAPERPSDAWISAIERTSEAADVRGVVVDDSQSYASPKLIEVQTDDGTVRVFTWLNLYAGAFRTGDEVEVIGNWAEIRGQRLLLVENSGHAIRIIARTSTDPV
jgi:predicted nucleotidyltransferase